MEEFAQRVADHMSGVGDDTEEEQGTEESQDR